MPLLDIQDLHVEFPTQGGVMHAVAFQVRREASQEGLIGFFFQ